MPVVRADQRAQCLQPAILVCARKGMQQCRAWAGEIWWCNLTEECIQKGCKQVRALVDAYRASQQCAEGLLTRPPAQLNLGAGRG